MKKLIAFCICIMMTLNLMTGCESSGLGKGKTMILDFETNPTTGYDWDFTLLEGDEFGRVELEKDDMKLNDDMNLIGAPSRHIYYFIATKPGKQKLTFTYRRPWKGGGSIYDVVYELSVDKKLNIKYLKKEKGVVESDKDLSFFPDPVFE